MEGMDLELDNSPAMTDKKIWRQWKSHSFLIEKIIEVSETQTMDLMLVFFVVSSVGQHFFVSPGEHWRHTRYSYTDAAAQKLGKTDSSWMTLNLGFIMVYLFISSKSLLSGMSGMLGSPDRRGFCSFLKRSLPAYQFEVQKTNQKWSNVPTMLAVPRLKQEELAKISNHFKSPKHFAKAATLHSSYHYPLPINALVMVRCDLCQICHYGTLEFDLYPLYTVRSTPIRSQATPRSKLGQYKHSKNRHKNSSVLVNAS